MGVPNTPNWEEREKQELVLDEGRTSRSYRDQFGNWTNGIGHFLGPNPIYANVVWDDPTIDQTFAVDFEDAVLDATRAYPSWNDLDDPRKGAIVNMAFQLGAVKLSRFVTFFSYLAKGEFEEAAQDLMNHTLYAKQTPARASRIAYRIRTGQYSNDR